MRSGERQQIGPARRPGRARSAALLAALALLASPTSPASLASGCGTEPDGARNILALHAYAVAAGRLGAVTEPAPDRDQADLAILADRGDLVARRNPFDLAGAAVRFAPGLRGGYGVTAGALPLESPGAPFGLGDDDARGVDLPFAFPFYGKSYTRTFLGSDGDLTFGGADVAPTERGLGRFLSGPPRIAPFFADLDPSRGGSVSVRLAVDHASFLWIDVPGAGQINANSFEVTLHPDGAIDMVWGRIDSRQAVVGISPGGALQVTPVDLSAASARDVGGALAERFSETEHVDLVSVAHRFYAAHADLFDQIVVYTTRPLNPVPGTLAFELNVRNDVRGIGLPVTDDSAAWGSAGRLSSLVFMGAIDPYLDVDGLEVLAHEVGHRWLARLLFRDPTNGPSGALLDAAGIHWSFFLDSDSVLGGNVIEERGGGRFETVDFALGYSALDQYAMGLRAASEVAPFFYVAEPDEFLPDRPYKASSPSEAGVSFTGVRRDLGIGDILAAMGPRVPAVGDRLLRQAFILVEDAEAPATPSRVAAEARIRERFEAYFRDATGGRGIVDSTLH